MTLVTVVLILTVAVACRDVAAKVIRARKGDNK